MALPEKIRIVEVGPRDGLQSVPSDLLPLDSRIEFINMLSESGLIQIEVASFVSPGKMPGMSDSEVLFSGITRNPKVAYTALVPNLKGFNRAMASGVDEVVILTAASETFAEKNINCSIAESLERFKPVLDEATKRNVRVRGDISVVMGCPYEGDVPPEKVAEVARELYQTGCYEITLCDTIGSGNPLKTKKLIDSVRRFIPVEKIAAHFHDTFRLGLVNVYAAIDEGVSVIDSSAGGLGGCPYAIGKSDNVATEDVVYMLNSLGIETGVDLKKIIKAGNFICECLGMANPSRTSCTKS
jgi:hydroxymethylglutaryl-CoA lyase